MCIFVGKMASGNLYLFMCKCGASGVPSSGSEVERGLKARQTQTEGAQLLQNPLSGPATLDLGPLPPGSVLVQKAGSQDASPSVHLPASVSSSVK